PLAAGQGPDRLAGRRPRAAPRGRPVRGDLVPDALSLVGRLHAGGALTPGPGAARQGAAVGRTGSRRGALRFLASSLVGVWSASREDSDIDAATAPLYAVTRRIVAANGGTGRSFA